MKRYIRFATELSYPSKQQIEKLESNSNVYSVEDAYQEQCIDAINAGLQGREFESDSSGISVFEYDEETGESFLLTQLSNDAVKDLEIEALKESSNWKEFHNNLASKIDSYI